MLGFFNNNKYGLTLIFFFALAIRILFVLLLPLPAPDTEVFDALALNLLQHGNYSYDNITAHVERPPLYPFFLAGIYALFGHSFLAVRLIQSLIDSITCIFMYRLAGAVFKDRKIAITAFIIGAGYPCLISSCSYVLTETLTTFLITGFVYLLTCILASPGYWLTVVSSGIFFGAATLCRPITLLWPAALLFSALVLRLRRKIFMAFFWICVVMALTIAPWTIRNWIVFKKVIPVGIGGGANLWLGSYQPWDGDYNYKDLSDKNKIMAGLSPIEADKKLKQEAIKNIKSAPLVYVKLCVKKFGRFWFQIPGSKEVLKNKPFARTVIYLAYFAVLLFFILGLGGLFKRWNILAMPALLMIGYFSVLHVLLFVIPRYRIPIMPLVIVISASGIWQGRAYLKKRKV